ncbi:MAG: ABC transporter substrate-binding protein [Lachnospiraceae bacterium]
MKNNWFKKTLAISLTAAMALGTLAGCGGSSDNGAADGSQAGSTAASTATETKSTGDKHLNFGCYVYSTDYDPAAYQNAAWDAMRHGVAECLFKFNDDLTVANNLCDDYTVSDDHKTWTFHIVDGVKFSNGDACDATAVANSLNRLYNVCATDAKSSTPETYLAMESITANADDNTVTIVTKEAYADLTSILCFPFYEIIDVQGDLTDAEHDYSADPTLVIGTGPYVIKSKDQTTKNSELVKNENYWNGEVPYDSVSVIFIEDDSTKAMSLQSGDIDLTENITTAADLNSLKENDDYYVSQTPGMRTGFAYVNFNGVLKNDALRQAVMMAVDGQTQCDVTVNGMYTYGYAVLPSTLSYDYSKLNYKYGYDVEGAKKLLDDAGIVDKDGDGIRELDGQNINLNYITYVNRCLADFAQAVQISLSEIGIGCTVNNTDSDTEWNLMQAGEYDLCDSNWTTVGTGEPSAFLKNWYGGDHGSEFYSNGGGTNYCFYENDEFDGYFDQYMASTDTAERADLVIKMEQVLLDDAAVLVHGYYNSSMISNKAKVAGADISTVDYYWLKTDIKPAS